MKKTALLLLILVAVSSFAATAQEIIRQNASESMQILFPTDIGHVLLVRQKTRSS